MPPSRLSRPRSRSRSSPTMRINHDLIKTIPMVIMKEMIKNKQKRKKRTKKEEEQEKERMKKKKK